MLDDDFDDDFDEDFDDEPAYGEYDADGLDIPDFSEAFSEFLSRGAWDAISDIVQAFRAQNEAGDIDRGLLSVETIFDTTRHEVIPGLSREFLSVRQSMGLTLGTLMCRSLSRRLNEYYDRLLFGLVDDVYLHTSRSITFNYDRICAGVSFFWDERKSPYKLIIPDASLIRTNKAFIYLVVGDLLEEMIDGLEETTDRTDRTNNSGDNGNVAGNDDKGKQG